MLILTYSMCRGETILAIHRPTLIMLRRLTVLAATLAAAFAADPEPRWRELNRTAREAVQAKDYAKLRDTLLQLRPLLPGNPRITYNLAASKAMLGNREAALAALGNLAAMGLVYDLSADTDFDGLRSLPRFQAVTRRIAAWRQPVTRSTQNFPITEPDLIPEDLAYDTRTRRFFYSSVRRGRIYNSGGKEFARAEWSIFALRADPARRLLWASTGWVPQCEACKPEDKDKTALLAFDLDTGALRQRIDSPVPGLLGDMTISRQGDLFVCEGIHGAVLHLASGAKQLIRLDTAGEFPSPQTPALSSDGRTLYVPDYLRGIAAMRLSDRHIEWLQPGDGIALNGIDGLYLAGRSFLAVQNGTKPPRLMRFSLDLRRQEILEANSPWLGEPTHGVIAGHYFYFIANAGWDQYDAQGRKKPGAAPVESTVRRLPLP
jgi:hypothetical protein